MILRIGNTGHRPGEAGLELSPRSISQVRLQFTLRKLYTELAVLVGGPENLLINNGGAIGFDLCSMITSDAMGLELSMYLPFPGQAARWDNENWSVWVRIMDRRIRSNEEYCKKNNIQYTYLAHNCKFLTKEVFLSRNKVIVDNSDWMVAFFGLKTFGGTWHTLGLAQTKGIPVTVISPLVSDGLYRIFHYAEHFSIGRYHHDLRQAGYQG